MPPKIQTVTDLLRGVHVLTGPNTVLFPSEHTFLKTSEYIFKEFKTKQKEFQVSARITDKKQRECEKAIDNWEKIKQKRHAIVNIVRKRVKKAKTAMKKAKKAMNVAK